MITSKALQPFAVAWLCVGNGVECKVVCLIIEFNEMFPLRLVGQFGSFVAHLSSFFCSEQKHFVYNGTHFLSYFIEVAVCTVNYTHTIFQLSEMS